jgi:hypothetical protein
LYVIKQANHNAHILVNFVNSLTFKQAQYSSVLPVSKS